MRVTCKGRLTALALLGLASLPQQLAAQPSPSRASSASLGACKSQEDARSRKLREAFDRWDSQNGGVGFTQFDNVLGVLANNEPQVLEAYLIMYEATQDTTYLFKAAAHGQSVLDHRDDYAGRVDYSGRANPVWSNRNPAYVRGDRLFPFSAESAWLSYPLAYFAHVVRRDPALSLLKTSNGRSLGDIADRFASDVEKTIAYHSKDWHGVNAKGRTIGFYTTARDFPDAIGLGSGSIEPMNFQTSMGRLFTMMYLATGHEAYLTQARQLANFLLADLSYDRERDSYYWTYWPRASYFKSRRQPHRNVEDISHGGLTVDFVRLMFEHRLGIVGERDMRRFSNMFVRSVYRGRPGRFALTLNGQGAAGGRVRHLGYYAGLAGANRTVGRITLANLEALGLNHASPGSALMFVAVASQLKYETLLRAKCGQERRT